MSGTQSEVIDSRFLATIHSVDVACDKIARQRHEEIESKGLIVSKLPLKRRFSEYRHSFGSFVLANSVSSQSKQSLSLKKEGAGEAAKESRFLCSINALDKLKDVAPVLTVAVFSSHCVVSVPTECQAASPQMITITNRTEDLLLYFDTHRIPPCLEQLFMNFLIKYPASSFATPFVDGCICVGITLNGNGTAPESRKVLLRPSWSNVITDMRLIREILPNHGVSQMEKTRILLEIEKKVLLHTTDTLVLEPSENVLPILTHYAFNASAKKIHSVFDRKSIPFGRPILAPVAPVQSNGANYEPGHAHKSKAVTQRFFRLAVAENVRSRCQAQLEADATSLSLSDGGARSTSWGSPGSQTVMRTLRFERDSNGAVAAALELAVIGKLIGNVTKYFGVLRLVSLQAECTVENSFYQEFPLGSLKMADNYISCLRFTVSIFDASMRLASDIINPLVKAPAGANHQLAKPSTSSQHLSQYFGTAIPISTSTPFRSGATFQRPQETPVRQSKQGQPKAAPLASVDTRAPPPANEQAPSARSDSPLIGADICIGIDPNLMFS